MEISCLWCTDPVFIEDNLFEFCFGTKQWNVSNRKKSHLLHKGVSWREQAQRDLQTCFDCVQVYHQMLNKAFSSHKSIFMPRREEIYVLNVDRITKCLQEKLKSSKAKMSTSEGDLDLDVLSEFSTPLKEVLKYPRYLLDEKLNNVVLSCLEYLISTEEADDIVSEKLPGIYLLLVYPDKQVQKWAFKVVRSLGPLEWDNYDEMEEVIGWLMAVITFNLFLDTPSTAGRSAWDHSEVVCLPGYLFTHESPKQFWVGISMLITSLDNASVRNRFLSSTSVHKHLIDAVLNALSPNADREYYMKGDVQASCDTVFWPVLHILSILLDRLGFCFWQLTSKAPADVCKLILSQPYFVEELNRLCLEEDTHREVESFTKEDTANSKFMSNFGSNSINCLSSLYCENGGERNCTPVALTWIMPFVLSILQFGELMEPVVRSTLIALCSIYMTSLSSKPCLKSSMLLGLAMPQFPRALCPNRKLSNCCLLLLAQLIEILFTKEAYSLLLKEKSKWLPIISSASENIFKLLNDRHSELLPSLVAVRKTIFSLINCPVGRRLPQHTRLVVFFSPKLKQQFTKMQSTPPAKKVIDEAILKVLEECLSKQDILGPFIPFQNNEINVSIPYIKQERQEYDSNDIEKNQTDPSCSEDSSRSNLVKSSKPARILRRPLQLESTTDSSDTDLKVQKRRLSLSLQRKKNIKFVYRKASKIDCNTSCSSDLEEGKSSTVNWLMKKKLPTDNTCEENTATAVERKRTGKKRLFELDLDDEDTERDVTSEVLTISNSSSSSDDELPSFVDAVERITPSKSIKRPRDKEHDDTVGTLKTKKCHKDHEKKQKDNSTKKRRIASKQRAKSIPDDNCIVISSDSETDSLFSGPDHLSNTISGTENDSKSETSSKSGIHFPENFDDNCETPPFSNDVRVLSHPISGEKPKESSSVSDAKDIDSQINVPCISNINTSTNGVQKENPNSTTEWCSKIDTMNTLESLNQFSTWFSSPTHNNLDSEAEHMKVEELSAKLPTEKDAHNTGTVVSKVNQQPRLGNYKEPLSPTVNQAPDSLMEVDFVYEDISSQCVYTCMPRIEESMESDEDDNAIVAAAKEAGIKETLTESHQHKEYLYESDTQTSADIDKSSGPTSKSTIKDRSCISTENNHEDTDNTSSDDILMPARKKQHILQFNSNEELPTVSLSSQTDETSTSIYNEFFQLPTCASSTTVITPQRVQVRPLRVVVDKLNSENIRDIVKRIQQKELCIVSPHSKYREECQLFIQSQTFVYPQKKLRLVVSIELSLLSGGLKDKGISPFTKDTKHAAYIIPRSHSNPQLSNKDEVISSPSNANTQMKPKHTDSISTSKRSPRTSDTVTFYSNSSKQSLVDSNDDNVPISSHCSDASTDVNLFDESNLFSNSQVQVGSECFVSTIQMNRMKSTSDNVTSTSYSNYNVAPKRAEHPDLSNRKPNQTAPPKSIQISTLQAQTSVYKPKVSQSSQPKSKNSGVIHPPFLTHSRLAALVSSSNTKSTSQNDKRIPIQSESSRHPSAVGDRLNTVNSTNSDDHRAQLQTSSSIAFPTSTTTRNPSSVKKWPHPKLYPVVDLNPNQKRRIEDLYYQFLSWDPKIFLDPKMSHDDCPMRPKLVFPTQPKPVPVTFLNYDDYYNTFMPLTLLELWDNVYEELKNESTSKIPPLHAELIQISETDQRYQHLMKCKVNIAREFNYPFDSYMVLVDFLSGQEEEEDVHSNYDEDHFASRFAIVQATQCIGLKSMNDKTCAPNENNVELILTLRLMARDLIATNRQSSIKTVRLFTICHLSTILRQWSGLMKFHRSKLARDILYPRGGKYFGLREETKSTKGSPEDVDILYGQVYNCGQYSAIQLAVKMVEENYIHPRIMLLQGPPGTGKTHTITGIVQAVLKSLIAKQRQRTVSTLPGVTCDKSPPHILVCAPSNAAVDEVARRLLKDGLVYNTPQWREKNGIPVDKVINEIEPCAFGIRLVRVGDQTRIHKDIRKLSIQVLVDEAKKSNMPKDVSSTVNEDVAKIRKQLTDYENDIEKLNHSKVLASFSSLPTAAESLEKLNKTVFDKQEEKKILETQLKKILEASRLSNQREVMLRKKILVNADVICCTLSTSGRAELQSCFKDSMHFSCIIVDEASQCSELDVLIPLSFGSSKLLLVGDPAQLPATVKSRQAEKLGLGQSLFERLYKFFISSKENPVQMLEIQYRMLSQICHFPSQHFYRGKLLTARSLMQMDCAYGLRPFLVFDVKQGREKLGYSNSPSNEEECQLLMELVNLLMQQGVLPSHMGIITPYRGQEKLIQNELNKRFQLKRLEVGTVDGFQGREKDVIILSCVRAKSQSGSIGFLSSVQRMNVALTRAKKACYVLAHCDSLKVNKDWTAFVDYATVTKHIVSCSSRKYSEIAKDILASHSKLSPPCNGRHISNERSLLSKNSRDVSPSAFSDISNDLTCEIQETSSTDFSSILSDPRKKASSDVNSTVALNIDGQSSEHSSTVMRKVQLIADSISRLIDPRKKTNSNKVTVPSSESKTVDCNVSHQLPNTGLSRHPTETSKNPESLMCEIQETLISDSSSKLTDPRKKGNRVSSIIGPNIESKTSVDCNQTLGSPQLGNIEMNHPKIVATSSTSPLSSILPFYETGIKNRNDESTSEKSIDSIKPFTNNDTTITSELSQDSHLNGLDHETACHWPDSQSIPRPELLSIGDIDYNRCFPAPPTNVLPEYAQSSWRPHGGPRKRKAHADTEEILLLRKVAPAFIEEKEIREMIGKDESNSRLFSVNKHHTNYS